MGPRLGGEGSRDSAKKAMFYNMAAAGMLRALKGKCAVNGVSTGLDSSV